jgi:hypothetical protein
MTAQTDSSGERLAYDDVTRPDFLKLLSEKQEPKFLADLAKVSVPLSVWARRRLAEGFTVQTVSEALKVATFRQKLERLKP